MIASSANVITDVEQSELEEKDKIHEKADELLQMLNSTISDILAAAVEVEAFLDTHTVCCELGVSRTVKSFFRIYLKT
jgi:hypothetical protein